jgi:hypothetical protein
VADEHYVASLLAAYNMGDTADGIGLSTFTDWWSQHNQESPRTFGPGQASASHVAQYMRSRLGPAQCVPQRLCARMLCGCMFSNATATHHELQGLARSLSAAWAAHLITVAICANAGLLWGAQNVQGYVVR